MMSGHNANPICFNKENKDWRFRALANPHPRTSDNISFLPYPPPSSQTGRHMCINPSQFCVKIFSLYLGRNELKKYSQISLLFFKKITVKVERKKAAKFQQPLYKKV